MEGMDRRLFLSGVPYLKQVCSIVGKFFMRIKTDLKFENRIFCIYNQI